MLILIDTREKTPLSFSFYQLATKVTKLDVGDYAIAGLEKRLAIERKASTSELSLNLCTKTGRARFERELTRMDDIDRKILLCEFPESNMETFPVDSGIPKYKWPSLRISAKYLRKSLHEVEEKFGLEVIFSDNQRSAEAIAYALLRETHDKFKSDLLP